MDIENISEQTIFRGHTKDDGSRARVEARETHVAESGRVHARGGNASERSNARVAKNGDPRLKTEQRQGMQRVAAHLAIRSGRQPTTASPAWRAHGDGLHRLDRRT